MCLLKAHYREDVEYDVECFRRTQKEYDAMDRQKERAEAARGGGTDGKVDALLLRTREAFLRALDDDVRTDDAVYALQQMTEALEEIESFSPNEGRAIVETYEELGGILGLFQGAP